MLHSAFATHKYSGDASLLENGRPVLSMEDAILNARAARHDGGMPNPPLAQTIVRGDCRSEKALPPAHDNYVEQKTPRGKHEDAVADGEAAWNENAAVLDGEAVDDDRVLDITNPRMPVEAARIDEDGNILDTREGRTTARLQGGFNDCPCCVRVCCFPVLCVCGLSLDAISFTSRKVGECGTCCVQDVKNCVKGCCKGVGNCCNCVGNSCCYIVKPDGLAKDTCKCLYNCGVGTVQCSKACAVGTAKGVKDAACGCASCVKDCGVGCGKCTTSCVTGTCSCAKGCVTGTCNGIHNAACGCASCVKRRYEASKEYVSSGKAKSDCLACIACPFLGVRDCGVGTCKLAGSCAIGCGKCTTSCVTGTGKCAHGCAVGTCNGIYNCGVGTKTGIYNCGVGTKTGIYNCGVGTVSCASSCCLCTKMNCLRGATSCCNCAGWTLAKMIACPGYTCTKMGQCATGTCRRMNQCVTYTGGRIAACPGASLALATGACVAAGRNASWAATAASRNAALAAAAAQRRAIATCETIGRIPGNVADRASAAGAAMSRTVDRVSQSASDNWQRLADRLGRRFGERLI